MEPSLSQQPEKFLEEAIKRFVAESETNRLTMIGNSPIFDEPLVAFASGNDPIFTEYKEKK